MEYVEFQIGKIKALMPSIGCYEQDGKGIRTTAAGDRISTSKALIEEFVASVASSLHDKLKELPPSAIPNQIELSMSIGFSGQLKVWVLGAKAEHSIGLKLVWSK